MNEERTTQRSLDAFRTVDRRDAGFSLIETLVAFAILSVSLTVLFAGVTRAIVGSQYAQHKRLALRIAQNQIEEIGITVPIQPGERKGRSENGFAWAHRMQAIPQLSSPASLSAWVEVSVWTSELAVGPPAITLLTAKRVQVLRQ
jgi:type II secretion system protein I